jgi:hypothetical protein
LGSQAGDVYLALIATLAKDNVPLLEQRRNQPGLILGIDGVQPEQGHVTRSMIRDCLRGCVLAVETALN